MPQAKEIKVLAQNRKARHDFFIEDTYEAGIVLTGTEVKSLRAGRLNLRDSYIQIKQGEAVLEGMHISPYEKGNIFNKDPLRARKLLLHKQEIRKLNAQVMQQGYSIVPLQVYLSHGLVKLQIALVKGKKLYDKREDIAGRDAAREIERHMKGERRLLS